MRIIAFLMSFLSIFALWNVHMQPNCIPETRVAPVDSDGAMPDRFGIWPTEEFTEGQAPWWFSPLATRQYYNLKGLFNGGRHAYSLLVLYQGELVYEWYDEAFDETTRFNVASVTKNVLATLVGIAIYEDYIECLDQNIIDFFPEAEELLAPDSNKRDMTIDHLLTMTSGLEDLSGWQPSDGGLAAFLQPQLHAPGRRFSYDFVTYNLLAAVVSRATGQPLHDFAQAYLFEPLGITSVDHWPQWEGGNYIGSGGMLMAPRDMLRLGYFWLNYGRWEDAQLLCPHFIAQAAPRSMAPVAYGRSFWNNWPLFFFTNSFEASGVGGQFITVSPRMGMVVVRTGGSVSAN